MKEKRSWITDRSSSRSTAPRRGRRVTTNRVAHPCEGLAKAAFAAFDAIAAGQQPRASERTIAVLMERGLIQRTTSRVHFGDGMPPAETFSYSIPYEHHIQWCEHWDSPAQRGPTGRQKSKRSVSAAGVVLTGVAAVADGLDGWS